MLRPSLIPLLLLRSKHSIVLFAAFVCLATHRLHAQVFEWNNASGGSWSVGSNWVGGVGPNLVSHRARFGLDASYTVQVTETEPHAVEISDGSVVFDMSGDGKFIQGGISLTGKNVTATIDGGRVDGIAWLGRDPAQQVVQLTFQNGAEGNAGTVVVGEQSDASLEFLSSSQGNFNTLELGYASGASATMNHGTLAVRGGSDVTIAHTLRVGRDGRGSAFVTNGSTLEVQVLPIDAAPPPQSGIGLSSISGLSGTGLMEVRGIGSRFVHNQLDNGNNDAFLIGSGGSTLSRIGDGELGIYDGGRFQGNFVEMANNQFSKAKLVVSGAGSLATMESLNMGHTFGAESEGSEVEVLGGGRLETSGFGQARSNASVLVSGENSHFRTTSGSIRGSFTLENAATAEFGYVDNNANLQMRGELTVTGVGSKLQVDNMLVESTSFDALNILDGGELTSQDVDFRFGTAEVAGNGARWRLIRDFELGPGGPGGANLIVGAGGSIVSASSLPGLDSGVELAVHRDSVLQFDGGTMSIANATVHSMGTLLGNGQLTARVAGLEGSTISADGDLLILGSMDTIDGFSSLGKVTVSSQLVLQDADRAELNGLTSLEGGSILAANGVLIGGTLEGSGIVSAEVLVGAAGHITANAGTLTLGDATSFNGFQSQGKIDIQSGATLEIRTRGFATLGTFTTLSGGTLRTANGLGLGVGQNLVGTGVVEGTFAGGVGSRIIATGSLAIGDDAVSAFTHRGELYTGAHTVELVTGNRAALGSLTTLGDATGDGTLIADNGFYIDFPNAITGHGTLQSTSDIGRAIINNGSILGDSASERIVIEGYVKGVGEFDNVQFNGTFAPGLSPAITRGGNFFFGPSSILEMEIGGLIPGSEHDAIWADGLLALDGTLDVLLINGFSPELGNEFNLFNWGTLEDEFHTFNLPSLNDGLAWDTSRVYSTGVLGITAVPEPGSGIAILLLGLGISQRRKRS